MANYFVSIGEKEYQIRVEGSQIYLDGKTVDLKMAPLNGSGLHLLYRERKARELQIKNAHPGEFLVTIGGREIKANLSTNRFKARRNNSVKADSEELRAPMPGLVVAVQVSEGEQVKEGQSLVVLESMKMQMHIRASRDGQVKGLNVKNGEQVNKDKVLARVV